MRTRGFRIRADDHFNLQHLTDPASHQPHPASTKSGGKKDFSRMGDKNPLVEDGFVSYSSKTMEDQDGCQRKIWG